MASLGIRGSTRGFDRRWFVDLNRLTQRYSLSGNIKKVVLPSNWGSHQFTRIAEGKVTKVSYRNDAKPAGELAILRNYENIFKKLGGLKLTSNDASTVGAHLFFIEKDNRRTWMILDNSNNLVVLTFLEEKAMERTVTAGQLADSINKQGYATLYINFDTNKSEVKTEAQPALKEVVALLKAEPALRLSVEGHPDNVGSPVDNKNTFECTCK
jgi:OmpA-OmpF porin, OOP family